ncbi:MAG: hypothetical protein A3G25_08225 [Betaproteobacteria bacterium RIFCSPLOWO2_12_FULL_63_13]|nr:MAG: hypothetical protein A3G25_08225 [Betaproteobacteria bacterium RIFCSPLOWO2_12_FULL_63_13]
MIFSSAIKRLCAAAVLGWALSGCATTGGANPADPLQPINRAIFGFNDSFDEFLLKPVAEAYRAALPEPVRTGVTNFFSNIEDVWIGANNLLQGKPEQALQDMLRVVINTIFGIGGLMDVAYDEGLDKHNEDFGQTLGRWGIGSGPYLVLPFFGPSTLRDGVARLGVDNAVDPVWTIDRVSTRNSLYTVRAVNARAGLLDAARVMEQAALDKYRFVRDAYLQRRRSLIYDGDPPSEPEAKRAAAPDETTVRQPPDFGRDDMRNAATERPANETANLCFEASALFVYPGTGAADDAAVASGAISIR